MEASVSRKVSHCWNRELMDKQGEARTIHVEMAQSWSHQYELMFNLIYNG